jgi:hypothetical protein
VPLVFFDPLRDKSSAVEGGTKGAKKDEFASESIIESSYETLKRENNKKEKKKKCGGAGYYAWYRLKYRYYWPIPIPILIPEVSKTTLHGPDGGILYAKLYGTPFPNEPSFSALHRPYYKHTPDMALSGLNICVVLCFHCSVVEARQDVRGIL